MKRLIVGSFALTLSLAACAQAPTPVAAAPAPAPVADPTSASHCDASKVVDAIGRLPAPDTQEWARGRAGAAVVRVLKHNQRITKEYQVGRLNLVLDAAGKIASANCS